MKKDAGSEKEIDRRIGFFNHHAETWDVSGSDPDEIIPRLDEISDLLEVRRGEDALDVGCGTGETTRWLVGRVRPGRVVAVDFSEKMLVGARTKDIEAEFQCLDVCRDDLGKDRFDLIFCFQSFPHFRDQPAALRNFARALKPDGRIIVLHFAGREKINAFHDEVGDSVAGDHLPERAIWDDLLADAGLEMVRLIDEDDLFFLKAATHKR